MGLVMHLMRTWAQAALLVTGAWWAKFGGITGPVRSHLALTRFEQVSAEPASQPSVPLRRCWEQEVSRLQAERN